MNVKGQTVLWIAQRLSAALLAVCVAVHLATIVAATQSGLSAAAILARTRGSAAWFAFYTLFVLAAALHAPIGLRSVLSEWCAWRGPSRDIALAVFSGILLWTGMRAVWAVFQ